MTEIAFDESGNTGADLINQDQPVFTLASVQISQEKADSVVEELRSHQSREAKFTNLKKRKSGRDRILNVLASELLEQESICVTFIHKRYMIVSKIVDLLIETVANDFGVDIYENGGNIATSNLHFYCMSTFCGEGRTKVVLRNFVALIRNQDEKSIRKFYRSVELLVENCKDSSYAESWSPVLMSRMMIDDILAPLNFNSIDPAIPAFVEHCTVWGNRLNEDFVVVHDTSKPIIQERDFLERLMDKSQEKVELGYDRRKFTLPLPVLDVVMTDSVDDTRVQIGDILASTFSFWCNGIVDDSKRNDFWHALNDLDLDRFIHNAVWPSTDVSPEALNTIHDGGINPADGMAEFLHRSSN